MQRKIIYRDRQELQAQDLNSTQDFVEASFDTLIADVVADDRRYAGLTVAQSSNDEVTVAPGRVYDRGKVYVTDQATAKSLLTSLPVASKRIVSVVAFGQTAEVDVQPRSFVTDLASNETEPQPVAMRAWRKAAVDFVAGIESLNPQGAALPSGVVHIADVVLSATGVVSITQMSESRVPSINSALGRVAALEQFRDAVGAQVGALSTTVSGLQERSASKASVADVLDLQEALARLRRDVGVPAGALDYGFDDFSDPFRSAEDHPAYAAEIDGALLFPYDAPAQGDLDLFNPTDPNGFKSPEGLLFPRFDVAPFLQTSGVSGSASLSSFQLTSFNTRKVTRTRTYTHTGRTYAGVSFEAHPLEKGGKWRTMTRNYKRRYAKQIMGELEKQDVTRNARINYSRYSYTRTRKEVSYKRQETQNTISGAIMAQTFVAPRSGWLARIGLRFTSTSSNGDVTVALVRTAGGRPDPNSVLAEVTLPAADLRGNGTETPFDIGPVEISPGERYAIMIASNGGHAVALADGVSVLQGGVFYGQDGAFIPRHAGQSLLVTLYAATFHQPHVELRLRDQTRSGGITEIDVVAQELVPEGADVGYEVQVGGQWVPLEDAEPLVTTRPSTVPLRVVLTGTTDAMPAVEMRSEGVTVAKPATEMTHISLPRTLPSPSTHITVDLTVGFWRPGDHVVDVSLIDVGNATTLAADSASTTKLEDMPEGLEVVRKRFVFTPATAVSDYQIQIDGVDNSNDYAPFSVFERLDYAQ